MAGNSELSVHVRVAQRSTELADKAGVVWIRYFEQDGGEVVSESKLASGKNGHYVYLVPGPEGVTTFKLRTPTSCASVALGFAVWKASPGSLSLQNAIAIEQTISQPVPTLKAGNAGARTGQIVISPGEDCSTAFVLDTSPVWRAFSLHDTKDLECQIEVLDSAVFGTPKPGIVFVKFLDKYGVATPSRVEVPSGPRGDYFYVNTDASGRFAFRLHAPANAVTVELGFAAWEANAQRLTIRNRITFESLPASAAEGLRPSAPPIQSKDTGFLFDPQSANAADFIVKKSPVWIRLATDGSRNFTLSLNIARATALGTAKSGLLRVEAIAATGRMETVSGLKHSEEYGAYAYLDARTTGARTFRIGVPSSTVELRIAVQTWDAPDADLQISNELHFEATADPGATRKAVGNFRAVAPAVRHPREFKVALICDEFTFNSFKYEFDPIVLDPDSWQQQLEDNRPDIFLCESAWSGVDSNTRPWKGRVYASRNFAYENRRELLGILEWCRTENVPTVFWNKEDPTHYPDREHDFVATAVKFDHVFTTDRDCVEMYRKDYGHPSVHCLPFATQPRLFNPVGGSSRTDEVIFAGSWYANHEERSAEMLAIFRKALSAGRPVKIFDRFYGSTDELHAFPPELRPLTVPALSHAGLAKVYKSSLFGMNINTVTDSPTMFARRIFELMSSNTLVLSNDFAAAEEFFGDTLVLVGQNHDGLKDLTAEEIERKRDAALHNVLKNHTYRARFQQVLDVVGINYQRLDERVTVVYPVANASQASAALTSFSGLSSVAQGVLLVLSADIPDEDVRALYSEFNRYGATVVSAALALKQDVTAKSLVPTSHFVVLLPESQVTPEYIKRAMLHTEYVDSPIVLGSDVRYEFTPFHKVANLIAPREFIGTVLRHSGTTIAGDFYHV
ncbi:spore maturation protein CgeB [Arthrobacter sp. UYEF3]